MIALLWACGSPAELASGEGGAPQSPPVERAALRPCTTSWKSPLVVRPDDRIDIARAVLDTMVRDYARDPQNPWAVAHALLALGPGFTLTDGTDPIGSVYERYGDLDPSGMPDLPARVGDVRVEPHTDLFLKSAVEAGVAPDTLIRVRGAERPLADAWWGALDRTWVSGGASSASSFNDLPWTAMAIFGWAPPGLAWQATGHAMTADALASSLVGALRAETAFLREARASGGTFQKKRQGIFAYTCGGAHLIQGAAFGVARGFGTAQDRAAMDDEIALLLWRFPHEMKLVDDAIRARPDFGLVLVSQRLKFLGHTLETVHRAAAWGVHQPDGIEQVTLAGALIELIRTVETMEELGVPSALPALRAKDEQLYLDYVGDAAHALKGLDLATGRATVCR